MAATGSEAIARHFDERTLYMGLTYYGHPMSCAVGIATLEVYEEDGLIENCRKMGEVLADELRGILSRLAAVGDVRSIGLFSVVELVADRASRAPLDAARMNRIKSRLLRDGLPTFASKNMVFVCPPLCIKQDDELQGLGIMERTIRAETGG